MCGSATLMQSAVRMETHLCHGPSLASGLIPVGTHGQDCRHPGKPHGEDLYFLTCLCLRLQDTIESSSSRPNHMKQAHILCYTSHRKCLFSSYPVFMVLLALHARSVPTGNTKVEGSNA